MGEFVRLEVDEGVATIRLDRPPANAIDPQLSSELRTAVDECAARDDVRAVVLWGGERIFAAGADIKVMAGLGPDEIRRVVSALADACDAIEALPKITIAAINGYALGGGCEIALSCDLRYLASDGALGQPEIKIGVIPGAGGTQRLPRLVGPARAKELIYSGRQVKADEALAIGLANRVEAAERVYDAALRDARAYAGGPTLALAAAKRAIDAAAHTRGFALERDEFCALFATEDQTEGMRAFTEKRPPEFEGK